MYTLTHTNNTSYRIVQVNPGGGSPTIWLLQQLDSRLDWQWCYSNDDNALVFYYRRETFLTVETFDDVHI